MYKNQKENVANGSKCALNHDLATQEECILIGYKWQINYKN